jgi:hypothetical protein
VRPHISAKIDHEYKGKESPTFPETGESGQWHLRCH